MCKFVCLFKKLQTHLDRTVPASIEASIETFRTTNWRHLPSNSHPRGLIGNIHAHPPSRSTCFRCFPISGLPWRPFSLVSGLSKLFPPFVPVLCGSTQDQGCRHWVSAGYTVTGPGAEGQRMMLPPNIQKGLGKSCDFSLCMFHLSVLF